MFSGARDSEATDLSSNGNCIIGGSNVSNSSRPSVKGLLPTIRNDITYESDAIRDADFANHIIFRETVSADQNAAALVRFLGIDNEKALEIALTHHLFFD